MSEPLNEQEISPETPPNTADCSVDSTSVDVSSHPLVTLEFVADQTINLALQQNRIPVIKRVRVQSVSDQNLSNLEVRIEAGQGFAETLRLSGGDLGSGEQRDWNDPKLMLNLDFLASLKEALVNYFEVSVLTTGRCILKQRYEVELLPSDHWNGLRSLAELTAAFVLPNNRAVESILAEAAERLIPRGQALNGYQSKGRQSIALQVESIFGAIQARGIHYANPAASFEKTGQRVRLPAHILESGLATCLDTTLLFCAVAEQVGLHPLVVMQKGHAFCGIWLEDESFPESMQDVHSRLKNRVDLHAILPVETTLLCDAKVPFSAAVEAGRRNLDDESQFLCVIDVSRCRTIGIRPLPFLDDGSIDEEAMRLRQERAQAAQICGPTVEIEEAVLPVDSSSGEPRERGEERLARWKRNLLDLTLNNRLLNFRSTQKTMTVLPHRLAALEDALASGMVLTILPSEFRPTEEGARFDLATLSAEESEGLGKDLARGVLYAPHNEAQLYRRLTEIYRSARLSIEESGSNTLFLALGFLRWRRKESDARVNEAPLILIPLTLERKSVKDGYRLSRNGDEVMFNTSLLELMRVEFGLEIPGLDPLPEDESGYDIALILKRVRQAIADFSGWTVVEAAEIGLFSFSKFLIWKDLQSRGDDLRANPLVDHLVRNDGTVPNFVRSETLISPEEIDEKYPPSEVYAPLSADSTQLAAIFSAVEGSTFVLEGPPGTGKSQTIANLIVHALGKGLTVLFVAEKRVALEVVHRRLTQAGLGDFMLELHSNKASKGDVLKQLGNAFNARFDIDSREWEQIAESLMQRRRELNQYVETLHRKRPSGMSLWEGLNRLIELSSVPLVPLGPGEMSGVSEDRLQGWYRILEETRSAWQLVGDPMVHPLMDCRFDTPTRTREREAGEALNRLSQSLESLKVTLAEALRGFDLTPDVMNGHSVRAFQEVLRWLSLSDHSVPISLLQSEEAALRGGEIARAALERDQARSRYEDLWYDELAAPQYVEWVSAVREAEATGAFGRFFAKRKLIKNLRGKLKAGRDLDWDGVKTAVDAAGDFCKKVASFESLRKEGSELFGRDWKDASYPTALTRLADIAMTGEEKLRMFARIQGGGANVIEQRLRTLATMAPDCEERRSLARCVEPMDASIHQVDEAYRLVVRTLGLIRSYWGNVGDDVGFSLGVLRECLPPIAEKLNEMREWHNWLIAREAVDADPVLYTWFPRALSSTISGDSLPEAFEKAFLDHWVDDVIEKEPSLSGFLRQRHEERIAKFRSLDAEQRALSAQLVRARLAAGISRIQAPTSQRASDSETGILMRELQKRARHMPVRRLIEQIPRLLRLLKPCLLMSPLSVAQYLSTSREPYDVIIFDEASQITPWDSLGALARGRTAVIVGDPKQLPPTSFFQRGSDGEEWEEVEDLESILDECLAARIPTKRLGWHYRSRHESLIAFSNQNYYENGLLTFPSASRQMAVRHIHVPDGCYDAGRTRTNQKEAERVVQEIIERLSDPESCHQSLGVVTFSTAQQSLIEELLDKERAAKPELEVWFSDSVAEPVFVKNLESVQGDERDVILFSVGYGPDTNGRVSMNFGPLNRAGGQRRLNVAITRAREEILVISTLLPEQIDLKRTSAGGVRDLRSFLEFAIRGTGLQGNISQKMRSPQMGSSCAQWIAAALREHGYQVDLQVGCSGYRVDLAVVHPDHPGSYLMGIECDGDSYYVSHNARDRDELRQSVLQGLGWSLMRVWSLDWWRDPQREITRILERLEEAKASFSFKRNPAQTNHLPNEKALSGSDSDSDSEKDPASEETESSESRTSEDEAPFAALAPPLPPTFEQAVHPVYQAHRFTWAERPQEQFYASTEVEILRQAIREIIQTEAPISENLLVTRIRTQWGFKSSGHRITERVHALVRTLDMQIVEQAGTPFYWPSGANRSEWTDFRVPGKDSIDQRNVEDLPLEEIAAAAHSVLSTQFSLSKEGLVIEVARLLGFRRVGRKVNECIAAGIDLLISRGQAEKE